MLKITWDDTPKRRRCGDCQLCCKLLPTREFNKRAGERCKHQRVGKGCTIYPNRPFSCQVWSCRWLGDETATAALSRPDRSHYVIEPLRDFVTIIDQETGVKQNYEVIQVWIDPDFPNAYRDPALRAYLEAEGKIALVRWNDTEAFALFPPPSTNNTGKWQEHHTGKCEKQHTPAELAEMFGGIDASGILSDA
jgi:hypothetical protein